MPLKDIAVQHWTKKIDRMLEKRQFSFAHDTLKGIKNTIQETDNVTDKQVRAIKNIEHGKNMITND